MFKILIWHAQTLDLQLLFLTSLFFTGVGAFCVELQHLQIQGCHFLKSALNLDLTLSDDGECRTFFDSPRNYWFRCFLRRVMVILLQQKNFGPNVIYFVLGTLVIVARLTYSWPKHCLLLRDWRILDAEIGKTLENRRTSAKPWPSRPTGGTPGRLKQPWGYPPPRDTFRSDFWPVRRFYARLPPVGGKRSGL